MSVKVYPNPVDDALTVELHLDQPAKDVNLSFISPDGKSIFEKSLGDLAAGSHQIQIEAGGSSPIGHGAGLMIVKAGNRISVIKVARL